MDSFGRKAKGILILLFLLGNATEGMVMLPCRRLSNKRWLVPSLKTTDTVPCGGEPNITFRNCPLERSFLWCDVCRTYLRATVQFGSAFPCWFLAGRHVCSPDGKALGLGEAFGFGGMRDMVWTP